MTPATVPWIALALALALAACAAPPDPESCESEDPCVVAAWDEAADACVRTPIEDFVDGDGCCPAGATAVDDADCPAACGDGAVTGEEVCEADRLGGASCADFGYDGGRLACAEDCLGFDTSGCVRAFAELRREVVRASGSGAVTPSPDGRFLAVEHANQTFPAGGWPLDLYDHETRTLERVSDTAKSPRFSPGGRWLGWVEDGEEPEIVLLDLSDPGHRWTHRGILDVPVWGEPVNHLPGGFAFLGDDSALFYLAEEEALVRVDIATGAETVLPGPWRSLHLPQGSEWAAAVDGESGANFGDLHLIGADGTVRLAEGVRTDRAEWSCVAFASDGQHLVLASDWPEAPRLRVFDLETGDETFTSTELADARPCFHVSPDATWVVHPAHYEHEYPVPLRISRLDGTESHALDPGFWPQEDWLAVDGETMTFLGVAGGTYALRLFHPGWSASVELVRDANARHSHDLRWSLVYGPDLAGLVQTTWTFAPLTLVDRSTGEMRTLTASTMLNGEWTRDGRYVYGTRFTADSTDMSVHMARPGASGRDTLLARAGWRFGISPDGDHLVYHDALTGAVKVHRVADGVRYEVQPPSAPVDWTFSPSDRLLLTAPVAGSGIHTLVDLPVGSTYPLELSQARWLPGRDVLLTVESPGGEVAVVWLE